MVTRSKFFLGCIFWFKHFELWHKSNWQIKRKSYPLIWIWNGKTIHNSCWETKIVIGLIHGKYNGCPFARNLIWLQLVIQMVSMFAECGQSMEAS